MIILDGWKAVKSNFERVPVMTLPPKFGKTLPDCFRGEDWNVEANDAVLHNGKTQQRPCELIKVADSITVKR